MKGFAMIQLIMMVMELLTALILTTVQVLIVRLMVPLGQPNVTWVVYV